MGVLIFMCALILWTHSFLGMLVSHLPGLVSPDRERRLQEGQQRSQFTPLQLIGGALVLVATFACLVAPNPERTRLLMPLTILLAIMVLVWIAFSWIGEFLYLMSLRDEDFPGRHDKLIWAVALLLFAPVGIWAFRSYRVARWPEVKKSNHPIYHDVELSESV